MQIPKELMDRMIAAWEDALPTRTAIIKALLREYNKPVADGYVPPKPPKTKPKAAKLKRMATAALLALALSVPAHAVTVIFESDFGDATHGLDAPNASIPGWLLTPSVDVVGPGLYDIQSCHSENHCIDLDGSAGTTAGAIERSVSLVAGRPYLLTWYASGSQRDPAIYSFAASTATMRVSIGAQSTDLTLAWNAPWGAWAMPYTPVVNETVAVRFAGLPNNFVGLLLDDAMLIDSTNSTQMPEPGPMALIGAGLMALGWRRARQ